MTTKTPGSSLVPSPPQGAGAPPPEVSLVATTEAAQAFATGLVAQPVVAPSLPIIAISHKDGGFLLPTGELVEEVSGYPVYFFRTRRYYKRPPQSGQKGQPPDCWSGDLLKPHATSVEKQAEVCLDCPLNAFGTGRDGRSKACGEYLWTFLYNPQFGSPPVCALVSSPASLRPMMGTRFSSGYFEQARRKHGAFQLVWTTFRLKPMGDQVEYCVLDPQMGPAITDKDQAGRLRDFVNTFAGAMDALRLQTPAATSEGEE